MPILAGGTVSHCPGRDRGPPGPHRVRPRPSLPVVACARLLAPPRVDLQGVRGDLPAGETSRHRGLGGHHGVCGVFGPLCGRRHHVEGRAGVHGVLSHRGAQNPEGPGHAIKERQDDRRG